MCKIFQQGIFCDNDVVSVWLEAERTKSQMTRRVLVAITQLLPIVFSQVRGHHPFVSSGDIFRKQYEVSEKFSPTL